MRRLDKITRIVSLYEMKALYDIALILKHTQLDYTNSNQLRVESNVYRFIYGDSDSISESLTTLNYRYRSVEGLSKTHDALMGKCYMDVVEADILSCYSGFAEVYFNRVGSTPRYGSYDITQTAILNALTELRKTVTELMLKLFHGETVYTLLLATPVGRQGLYSRATAKFYGLHKEDIGDTDYASFHDYLIRKNSRILNMDSYIDIQGLVFYCLGQYFSEVSRNPSIQTKYMLKSAVDIETRKGIMDKSGRDLFELKSDSIPNYSLTKLFNLCRELDTSLFVKRNTQVCSYSILEWYAEYTSMDIKQHIKKVQNLQKLPAMSEYRDSFENLILLSNSGTKISEDFTAKIGFAKDIFSELYENWYLQRSSKISRTKINNLCALCEKIYNHCMIDYSTNTHYGSQHKIINGVLDVSNVYSKKDANAANHYVNLKYYTSVTEELRDNYTSVRPEEVAVYLNPHLQANVRDEASSFTKGADTIEFNYVLLPAGWKRIQHILSIFQELEDVTAKLHKIGASIYDIIPAYYNGMPCTLSGALDYVLQERRVSVFSSSTNPLFDGSLLTLRSSSLEEATTFDWSLPKPFRDPVAENPVTDIDLVKITTGLCGLGRDHYPKYLEAILFDVMALAFPESIADWGTGYGFYDNIVDHTLSNSIGTYSNTDYTSFMARLGCVCPEKSNVVDFKLNDTDMEQTDLFNDDFLTLLQDVTSGISLENLLENLEDTQTIDYRIDLRKEFFTKNNVNSLYTIVLLLMLLCDEFTRYKTNSYNCKYIGLDQATKRTWTSRVNNKVVSSFKEIHTPTVRDLGPRVEDVIGKIAGAVQCVLNEDTKLGALKDSSQFILTKDSISVDIIGIISNMLLEDESLCIPALSELSIDTIKRRLLGAKGRLKPFTYSSRNYVLAVVSVDTIIINGEKYFVTVEGNYMYATPKNKSNTNVYKVSLYGQSLVNIQLDDGWKQMFRMTQNNGAIKYLYRDWEPKVRELVDEICRSVYDMSITPIVFTTKNVWQLIRYVFCHDNTYDSGYNRPITVKEVNILDNTSYTDPQCPPSSLITETCREVTNTQGEIEEVYEYYWSMENNCPVVLDYLALWNNAAMFLQAFGDIHQLAYALQKVAIDPKYRYDKAYKDYLCQGFIQLLWEQTPEMDSPIQVLDYAALMATDTDIYRDTYSPYKPIRWNNPELEGTPVYEEKCKQLFNLQSEGVRSIINADNITYHTGTSMVMTLPELLPKFRHKIDAIQKIPLYDVKGIDETAATEEEQSKLYNLHRAAIKQFVAENRTALNAVRIGTEKTGRSLQDERFYRANKWIRDQETGILCKRENVPYMVTQGNLIGFLYHLGYWICIDKTAPDKMQYKVYEEMR